MRMQFVMRRASSWPLYFHQTGVDEAGAHVFFLDLAQPETYGPFRFQRDFWYPQGEYKKKVTWHLLTKLLLW